MLTKQAPKSTITQSDSGWSKLSAVRVGSGSSFGAIRRLPTDDPPPPEFSPIRTFARSSRKELRYLLILVFYGTSAFLESGGESLLSDLLDQERLKIVSSNPGRLLMSDAKLAPLPFCFRPNPPQAVCKVGAVVPTVNEVERFHHGEEEEALTPRPIRRITVLSRKNFDFCLIIPPHCGYGAVPRNVVHLVTVHVKWRIVREAIQRS